MKPRIRLARRETALQQDGRIIEIDGRSTDSIAAYRRGLMRHTFASTMLSRNAPLLYVQKQGGWRSAAVLLRGCARWLPESAGAPPAATPAKPELVAALRAAGH